MPFIHFNEYFFYAVGINLLLINSVISMNLRMSRKNKQWLCDNFAGLWESEG